MQLHEIDIHRPQRYAKLGYPWADWDLLRREAPVYRYERDDIEPFWAVTRYDDIMTVSGRPEVFINSGPRLRLALKDEAEMLRGGAGEFGRTRGWDPDEPPDFVFMDDPRHRHMRKVSSWAFTQGCMRGMATHFNDLTTSFATEFAADLEAASARGESIDFVHGFSAKLPLAAIGEILGLPDGDWKMLLEWSEAIVGQVSPENIRPGETISEAAERSMFDFRVYLEAVIRAHRKPGGGPSAFINRLVEARVDGELLTEQQLNGYLFLLIGGGNDTTRNATSGGVAALLEHPEQCELLSANPDLLPGAIDEILRWTSPVISFLRTVASDTELRGTKLKAGETVCVFYPSGNRDESKFEQPYRFDIRRSPNEYLTFGFGAHFCLGTNLARAELRAMLQAILPLLPRLALAPGATRIAHSHVSGYASLPVKLR